MGRRDFFMYRLLGERFFQRFELLTQLVWQLVAELREVFADARAVFTPALSVERQQLPERLDRHAAAVEVDVLGLRLVADDRLVRAHFVKAALEDPLEHA